MNEENQVWQRFESIGRQIEKINDDIKEIKSMLLRNEKEQEERNQVVDAHQADMVSQTDLNNQNQKIHEENQRLQDIHNKTQDDIRHVQEELNLNTNEYQIKQDSRIDSNEKFQKDFEDTSADENKRKTLKELDSLQKEINQKIQENDPKELNA